MMTAEEFLTYQKPAKDRIVNMLIEGATHKMSLLEGEKALGLFEFMWFHMDTKDPLTKALVAKLNKTTTKIFKNYRGSKTAWYLGSQNDERVKRAFEQTVTWLRQQGVKCYLCAELD